MSIAIDGYDTVSYFDGRPAKGSAGFTHDWGGKTWHFGSATNRDRFARSPVDFAPQHDGICSFASVVKSGQPDLPAGLTSLWAVSERKLFLFSQPSARFLWKYTAAPGGKLKNWLILVLPAAAIAWALWTYAL